MAQLLNLYSLWLLHEGRLINTKKNSFWIPKSQSVHDLYFNTMTNKRISSSCVCAIYQRIEYYCSVQFMVVLANFNFPNIMVVDINHLVSIGFCYVGTSENEYSFKQNFFF